MPQKATRSPQRRFVGRVGRLASPERLIAQGVALGLAGLVISGDAGRAWLV